MNHKLNLCRHALVWLIFFFSPLVTISQEGKTYYSLINALENPGDVYILNLSKNDLRDFPMEIASLPNLKVLDLSFNRLQSLPPEIGKLGHLQVLDVSFNRLSQIPPEIGNVSELKELNLSFNKLNSLPPEVGKMENLRTLNISFNNINHLPSEIENIEGLQFFSKKFNPARGFTPEIKAPKKKNKNTRTYRVFCDAELNIPGIPEIPETGKGNDYKKEIKKNKHSVQDSSTSEKSYEYYYSEYADTINEPSSGTFDFSFFSSDEIKQLYRDAFNRKDYEQIALLQEELSKRAKETSPEDTTSVSYRGSGDPLKGLNVAKTKESLQPGKYYALIIGIDNYKGFWSRLKNAVNDAKSTEQLLRENYHFDEIRTLYNEAATRENIMKELEALITVTKENDNVFVYYSGHGEYRQLLNRGYWVPVDASDASTHGLIPNTDIQTFLAGIRSKHTLLITDACFSGDIFRGTSVTVPFEESDKYYRKVYDLVSRQALTAGSIEPVTDGGMEKHSVFTYYLLKSLSGNKRKYFDAGQLFDDIKIPVMNNTEQTPQLNPVKDTGDEGGQFIFIRKS